MPVSRMLARSSASSLALAGDFADVERAVLQLVERDQADIGGAGRRCRSGGFGLLRGGGLRSGCCLGHGQGPCRAGPGRASLYPFKPGIRASLSLALFNFGPGGFADFCGEGLANFQGLSFGSDWRSWHWRYRSSGASTALVRSMNAQLALPDVATKFAASSSASKASLNSS